MDLFERMTNIVGINQNTELETAIATVNEKLRGLTEERMCKVYNSLLLNELLIHHIPARMINTLDLGLDYEHIFLLIPRKNLTGGGYLIADLTFSQFNIQNEELKLLLEKGYQEINDDLFNKYLQIVDQKIEKEIILESAFYELERDTTRK